MLWADTDGEGMVTVIINNKGDALDLHADGFRRLASDGQRARKSLTAI